MNINLINNDRKQLIKIYEIGDSTWLWNNFPRKEINLFDRKKYLEEGKKSSSLCGDHKKKFKEIFGNQNFCYTTWYKGWVWFLEYDGLMISITSSIRGTDYRYYGGNEFTKKEIYEKIKGFVNELYEKVK